MNPSAKRSRGRQWQVSAARAGEVDTGTLRDLPMRCMRPIRCFSTAGLHGKAMLTATA